MLYKVFAIILSFSQSNSTCPVTSLCQAGWWRLEQESDPVPVLHVALAPHGGHMTKRPQEGPVGHPPSLSLVLTVPMLACSFKSILKTDIKTKNQGLASSCALLSISHPAITCFHFCFQPYWILWSVVMVPHCHAPHPPGCLPGNPQTCSNQTIHLLWVWRRKAPARQTAPRFQQH